MPLPLIGIAATGVASTIARIGAIFGIGLALREVRKTAEVVPKAADTLKSFVLPITLVGAALFVRAMKGK